MKKKVFIHSTVLLCATALTFFWTINEELSFYSLQLTAILLLTLIISHRLVKPPSFKLVESTVSTMMVILVVASSGGISSPLFFLNYLLLFELSLLLEPMIPLILSGALIAFYLLTNDTTQSVFQLLELLAFPLMTPLSSLLGSLYQKVKNQKRQIKGLSHKIEELEEELVEEELLTSSQSKE